MNNDDHTTLRINREIDYSCQLFRDYFSPGQVTIISVRALRRHCIVLGEVDGHRKIVRFDFSSVNVQPRNDQETEN